jgi:hypothetical protein
MASARDLQQETLRQQELIDKERRLKYANDPSSAAKVSRLNKKESKNTVKGGSTSKKHSIGPYGGQPDSSVDSFPVAPDYYRDGYLTTKTVVDTFTKEERRYQVWDPIPKLVGERKKDTLASIKLIDVSSIKNTDPNNKDPQRLIPEYTKFFLQSVQESEQEKVQIVDTFNNYYSFFSGKKPPVYNFSGYLLNLINYNWRNEFMYYYENFWRGTKAVERNARTFLTYNYQQVQGYILNVNTSLQAESDKGVPFSMSILVTKRLIFSAPPDYRSDSLVPRSDSGLLNLEADPNSVLITTEYLQGDAPADGNTTLDGFNREKGNRAHKEASDSSLKQNFSSFKKAPGVSSGISNASNLKAGLGIQ